MQHKQNINVNKKRIVELVQNHFFKQFKNREIQRLKKVCACNPQIPENYYDCVDRINKDYDQPRKKLIDQLKEIDKKYDDEYRSCLNNRNNG